MDFSTITITILGLLTTISSATSILFYRQNKNGATAGATEKWIAIFKLQNDILGDALNLKTKQVIDNEDKLEENRREISTLKYNQLQLERQQKGTVKKIAEMEERSSKAEYHYCSVLECALRKPSLGTYRPNEK